MIFIGTPTARSKDYCFTEWMANATTIAFVGRSQNHLIVDNSDDPDYMAKLRQFATVRHVQPKNRPAFEILADSHNLIREEFLKSKCEWLLHLESDVFPPIDVIPRLLAHDKPLVSAMYFIGNGANSYLLITDHNDRQGTEVRHRNFKKGNQDMMMATGELIQVAACGIGCTLIHRSVMERIKFRHIKSTAHFPDVLFYMDCEAAGIDAWLDTSLLCDHRNQDWSANMRMYDLHKS